MKESLKLFTDGGSRGNPGNAASAFFIFNFNNELITFGGEFLGTQTNNFAEYTALILGIKNASKICTQLDCYLDSELVVKQLNREYKVSNLEIKKLFNQVVNESTKLSKITFNHIPRKENHFADKLVNTILDGVEKF